MTATLPRQIGLIGLALLGVTLLGANGAPAIPTRVQQADTTVHSVVARYRASHSLADLGAAVDALDGTVQPDAWTASNFVEARRSLARSYATVLKAIEDAYDPTYNPNDTRNLPGLCVPPPRVAGAQPCMDPKQVADPAARAKYEQAIADNERKKERLAYYMQVKLVDEHAMSDLSATLRVLSKIAPSGIGSDSQALLRIFSAAGITAHRLTGIKGMIEGKPRASF